MDAIQEFEQYCALHPDPWLQAIQAIQNQPVQSFESWCQQYTPPAPPAPQEAQKEEDKQPLQQANAEIIAEKQAPLYQATVEDDTESTTESTTKHGSSMAVNKSTLPTIPRLCTTRSSGNSAACPSNLLASSLASFFGDFLTSFFGSASLLGYIRCMEGMEATGQG